MRQKEIVYFVICDVLERKLVIIKQGQPVSIILDRSRKALMMIDDLGRVSSEEEKRVRSCEMRLQREHIFKNFHCPTRE